MLWSAVDSLGIYFWFDINLKEISFILLPWTFFGFFLPAMEERKAAKALPFAYHFSLWSASSAVSSAGGSLSYHPLSSHQPLNIWMNFSQFLRGSSVDGDCGSWPQPPVLDILTNVVLKDNFTFIFKSLFQNLPEIRFQSFKISFKFIDLSWSFSPYTKPHFL